MDLAVFVSMLTLLFACVLPLDSGEPKACTEIGCVDGVGIDFSLSDPGSYLIIATTTPSYETTQCTATLPFDGTEGCTGPGSIGISGTELPADQQSIEGMTFQLLDLTEIHLNVNLDGATLIDHEYPISYVESQPNGPECEPTCSYASVTANVGDR